MKYGNSDDRAMNPGTKARSRAMGDNAKSRDRAMGGDSFTPCAGCPSPSACRSAGKCMGGSMKGKK
jgi:hypothetical protein